MKNNITCRDCGNDIMLCSCLLPAKPTSIPMPETKPPKIKTYADIIKAFEYYNTKIEELYIAIKTLHSTRSENLIESARKDPRHSVKLLVDEYLKMEVEFYDLKKTEL